MNDIAGPLVIVVIAIISYFAYRKLTATRKYKPPPYHFPPTWKTVLLTEVAYYIRLDEEQRKHFEFKVNEFLTNTRITGIKTTIDDRDKVLVAASAVIPIFSFPNWQYLNLKEVLIYPNDFGEKFQVEGGNRHIMGMVGSGYMEGMMILSKDALHSGFKNERDKNNTAIHEFVHLIDKADGVIDGIPNALMSKQYTIPWLQLMLKEMAEIDQGTSDINPYGASDPSEFLTVASEYFFERPQLLKRKHPELYNQLAKIFDQDLAATMTIRPIQNSISRNDPCPCGSGDKFKRCCGSIHYN